MISIIDHGLGNFKSIVSAVKHLCYDVELTRDEETIKKSEKIILPGVGSFGYGMKNLKKFNLLDILNDEILIKKKPILGICLGCQLFFESSEESVGARGLGWIKGKVKKLKVSKNLPKIHIGWNKVKFTNSPLSQNLQNNSLMYFNHSYYPTFNENVKKIASTKYGNDFLSIFNKENIFGIQPHPEKSKREGIQFLDNFLKI